MVSWIYLAVITTKNKELLGVCDMEERGLQGAENRMEVFRAIAEALNEANDVSTAMEAILPRLGFALGLQTAWAFRYDARRKSFVEVGASGLPPALECCHQVALKRDACECQRQFVQGELAEAVNIVRCSRLRDTAGDTRNLRFHASIPLRSKGKPLGILNVAAPGTTVFDEEALAFLQTVGQQVAVAIDRAYLLYKEREKASRLHLLSSVSANWQVSASSVRVLQQAVESYVDTFGYVACGVIRSTLEKSDWLDAEVIAVSERRQEWAETPHVYDDAETVGDVVGAPGGSILLANAQSVLSIPLPMTGYHLRLESPVVGAFDEIDEELLQAFAWQLSTAYVNAESYAQGMSHAQLQERHRIAADLHDAVSQRLFSAQLLLRTATMQLTNPSLIEQVNATVVRVSELIAEGQQEMRHLVRTLRPLDIQTTVTDELRKRVLALANQVHPKVIFETQGDVSSEPSLPIRETILAIADEALHNALRHAHANTIAITWFREGDECGVSIEDDGQGCPESQVGQGLGTRTMMERAQSVGGRLYIDGTTAQGTRVVVRIPIPG